MTESTNFGIIRELMLNYLDQLFPFCNLDNKTYYTINYGIFFLNIIIYRMVFKFIISVEILNAL